MNQKDYEHVFHYLRTHVERTSALLKRSRGDLSGKTVHELRISTKRVRAVLWLLRHSQRKLKFKNLDRSLRRLEKSLGKVRELDVASRDGRKFGVSTNKLANKLKKKRSLARKKLCKLLEKESQSKINQMLGAVIEEIGYQKPCELGEVSERLGNYLNRTLKNDFLLRTPKQMDFHHLRVKVKKIRYAFEALDKPVGTLKSLQDVLGEAHDLEILENYAGKDSKVRAQQKVYKRKALRLMKPTLKKSTRLLSSNFDSDF